MNSFDMLTMFALGLAGSIHCVQMCGPIVLAVGIPVGEAGRLRLVTAQFSYHLGRIFTYMLIGGAAGWFGSGVDWLGRLAGLAHAAAITGGVLLLTAGIVMLTGFRSNSLVQIGSPGVLSRITGRLLGSPAAGSKLLMGMALGFLPCGLVYAAVVKSITSASVFGGAAQMAAFGVGTAGPLAVVGLASPWLGRWIRLSNFRLAAVWVMAVGFFLLWRGILPGGMGHAIHHHH